MAPATLTAPRPDPSERLQTPPLVAEAPAATLRSQDGGAATPIPARNADHNETTWTNPENYILFPSGSARIDDSAMIRLQGHAARLKAAPSHAVTLVAHTALSGSRSYNLAVAEQRLHAVVKALRSLGVRGKQIRKINAGSKVVPEACKTETCRLELRSIELVYEQ